MRGSNRLFTNSQMRIRAFACVLADERGESPSRDQTVAKRWILIMELIYFFVNVMSETVIHAVQSSLKNRIHKHVIRIAETVEPTTDTDVNNNSAHVIGEKDGMARFYSENAVDILWEISSRGFSSKMRRRSKSKIPKLLFRWVKNVLPLRHIIK